MSPGSGDRIGRVSFDRVLYELLGMLGVDALEGLIMLLSPIHGGGAEGGVKGRWGVDDVTSETIWEGCVDNVSCRWMTSMSSSVGVSALRRRLCGRIEGAGDDWKCSE